MEQHYPTTDQLSLIAAQLRLLVDLTLESNNLQGVDPEALTLVLQDLDTRLARIAQTIANDPQAEQCGGRR